MLYGTVFNSDKLVGPSGRQATLRSTQRLIDTELIMKHKIWPLKYLLGRIRASELGLYRNRVLI